MGRGVVVCIVVIILVSMLIIVLVVVLPASSRVRSDKILAASPQTNSTTTVASCSGCGAFGLFNVFSFSLYGKKTKYTKGMVENVKLIEKSFPGWRTWIYMANDVPPDIQKELGTFKSVRIIPTAKGNMVDRFFSIDNPLVATMIVRDAD